MDHNAILFVIIILLIIIIVLTSYFKNYSYFGNVDNPRKLDISRAPEKEIQKDIPAKIICLTNREFQDTNLLVSKYFGTVEKFNAIKGSDLYDFVKNSSNVSLRALNNIINETYRRAHADLGSINAIGCALSHYTIWSELKPGTGVCIFEGDAVLHADPIPYIKKVPDAHFIVFGTIFSVPNRKQEQTLLKLNNRFYGMHGYYISYEGAQLLMKNFFPIDEQIDSYISDFILIHNNPSHKTIDFNSYVISPGICTQFNKAGTSIQTKGIVCDV